MGREELPAQPVKLTRRLDFVHETTKGASRPLFCFGVLLSGPQRLERADPGLLSHPRLPAPHTGPMDGAFRRHKADPQEVEAGRLAEGLAQLD